MALHLGLLLTELFHFVEQFIALIFPFA